MSHSSVKVVNRAMESSLPLLLAALFGHLVTLYGLVTPLVSPGYLTILGLLSVVGATTAHFVRHRRPAQGLVLPGAVGLIAVFVLTQAVIARFGRSLPLDFALSANDISMIIALTLTASVATFFWVTDAATLFACVWSMAMIGLAATLNLNVLTLVCFALYFWSALFLLIHQQTLTRAGEAGRLLATRPALLWLQLRTATLLWLVTFVLGVLVAVPLQMLGRNMSLNAVLDRLKVNGDPKHRTSIRPRLSFDSPRSFTVGLGPVSDDDTLLFKVSTAGTHYWRGRTFATCLGNEWTPFGRELDGEEKQPERVDDGRSIFSLAPAIEGERRRTQRVKAQVSPVAGVRTMIHLAEPRRVITSRPSLTRRYDGTMAGTGGNLDLSPPPTDYELECEVSAATPAELNRSSRSYPAAIRERYLQEPNPGLLDDLAREAIGAQTGPYDQAEAIRKFVANRCTYSLDAPMCPPGRNPADWFLREGRIGYCDLYATAVTLLCRAAGIPARIATGFNAGEIVPEQPDTYHLRERNRHAWCEVFFTDYGWVAFDATALTFEATSAPVASPPRVRAQAARLPIGPIALAAVGMLGIAVVGGVETLRRRGKRDPRAPLTLDELNARAVLKSYVSALGLLQRHGAAREPSMTVGEHSALVTRRLGSAVGNAYRPLAELSEQVLFARNPDAMGLGAVRDAQAALAALKQALKERAS